MAQFPKAVEDAIESFSRLPGVGKKTAQRLVQHLLKESTPRIEQFSRALTRLKTEIGFCSQCFHITEKERDICAICADPKRDISQICVVEDFIDVYAIEQIGTFHGVYHVLHGVLSPLDGVGPSQLTLLPLFGRLEDERVSEVILATNPTMEGEATAMYIKHHCAERPTLTMSRIAKGMPMGGNIDYADEITLGNALAQRVGY